LIQVGFSGELGKATAAPCTVGGKAAACLDLFFRNAVAPAPQESAALQPSATRAAPRPTPEPMTKPASPPSLREAADDRYNAYSHLADPERLAPPILAKVQPIEKAVEVGTPSLRTTEPFAPPVETSFAARIETLLGKSLTAAYCNNAEATLRTDAWALGAMVDVGLCAAARGDSLEGESILSRLLEYTPDNYEALVGRAVIAEQAGERGAALRYYQDALDAAAPVEESMRIVEAMAALS
jgi:tetratricopeptide (TPR) repeat protein